MILPHPWDDLQAWAVSQGPLIGYFPRTSAYCISCGYSGKENKQIVFSWTMAERTRFRDQWNIRPFQSHLGIQLEFRSMWSLFNCRNCKEVFLYTQKQPMAIILDEFRIAQTLAGPVPELKDQILQAQRKQEETLRSLRPAFPEGH